MAEINELFALVEQDQHHFESLASGQELAIALPESIYVHDIFEVVSVVQSVIFNEEFFRKVPGSDPQLTGLGKKLLSALKVEVTGLNSFFEGSRLSPLLDIFDRAKCQFLKDIDDCLFFDWPCIPFSKRIEVVVRMVTLLRAELNDSSLQSQVQNLNRAVSKNALSLDRFIDSLFICHSRILVIRLDVGCRLEYLQEKGWKICSKKVRSDFSTFLRLLRRGRLKESVLGYVWKLEFGPTKNYHYHVMVFLDGAKHQEDIVLCQEIGEIWSEKVAKEYGCYFNCNKKKKLYKKNGIGMVSWNDSSKMACLKFAAKYLVKKDLLIRPNLTHKERVFGKSNAPSGRSKLGRPRKVIC